MRTNILAFFVTLLSLSAIAEPGYKASDEQLKVFRAYYAVGHVDKPVSHLFHVWVPYGKPAQMAFCPVLLKAGEEETLELFIGGPLDRCRLERVPPVPEKLNTPPKNEDAANKIAGAIKSALKEKFGDGQELAVKLDYRGGFRVAYVEARTRVSRSSTEKGPLVKHFWYKFLIDPKFKTISLYSPAGGEMPRRSLQTDCYLSKFDMKCEGVPNYVNFVQPPEIEGSALITQFALPHYVNEKVARDAYAQLKEAILATVVELEKGSYKNPLPDVLAKQGDTLLPEHFNQYVYLDVTAMLGDSGNGSSLRFPIAEAYEKPYRGSLNVNEHFKADVVLDLKKGTYELTIKDQTGKSLGSANWVLDRNMNKEFEEYLIEDGKRAAIPSHLYARDPKATKPQQPSIEIKIGKDLYRLQTSRIEGDDVTAPISRN